MYDIKNKEVKLDVLIENGKSFKYWKNCNIIFLI